MNLKNRMRALETDEQYKQDRVIILFCDTQQTEIEARAALNEAKAEKGWQDIPDNELVVIRFIGVRSS